MTDPRQITEGSAEALEEMVSPRVEITGIAGETDVEKINEVAFELYKEALSVVNLGAHLLDDVASVKGGWPRNQAICAGLMIRIAKFMLVVVELSAKRNRAEVVGALNRSIMESVINLEFLVTTKDERYYDQFVKFSLGPERELYDSIQANVVARGGEVWPIEQRMLESINDVCEASGVKIEEVNRKYGDWGGGLRERLKALNKEERYVAMQRIPSHGVHGTWVDLYMNHLERDSKNDVFIPQPKFSWVDARLLGPIAILVLEATQPYLERYFFRIPETKLLLERIGDLRSRLAEADAVHEKLTAQKE
ncbi:MAG: DUF5677 domain-containing protein [Acidobacteriia bacterium]|nr:DUF5677 domain-containing protein [Terriglobia bacterium]